MQTWVLSLGWEDPLEKDMATHASILAWRIPMGRGAWWTTVHGVAKELDTTELISPLSPLRKDLKGKELGLPLFLFFICHCFQQNWLTNTEMQREKKNGCDWFFDHLCFLELPLLSFCIWSKFWLEWKEWPLRAMIAVQTWHVSTEFLWACDTWEFSQTQREGKLSVSWSCTVGPINTTRKWEQGAEHTYLPYLPSHAQSPSPHWMLTYNTQVQRQSY